MKKLAEQTFIRPTRLGTGGRLVRRVGLTLIAALLLPWGCDSGDSGTPIPETPTITPGLTGADVQVLMSQALGQALDLGANVAIAVTDREGNVLGAFRMAGSTAPLDDAAFGAIAKARTAAYLSSNQHGFTTLTACFITRKHFPPGIANTPGGPLFGVPFSSLSGGDIQPNGGPTTGIPANGQPGLTGVPGGVPVFKDGLLAGGLGVSGGALDFELDLCAGSSQDELIALAGVAGFAVPAEKRGDTILLDGIRLLYANVAAPPSPAATPAYADIADFGTVVTPARDAPPPRFPGEGPVVLDATHDFSIRAGTLLSSEDVTTIIMQAAEQANRTRAAIRRPIGTPARVFISVVDVDGSVLGIWRTRDATLFSYDVSAQKARTALAFSDPNHPLGARILQLMGLSQSTAIAFTTRAIGFLSQDFYPPGIDRDTLGRPVEPGPLFEGPEFVFQQQLGLQPYGNGITIFPGGIPLFRDGVLVGAIGISGDGVDQDDLIAFAGGTGFLPPEQARCDQFFFDGVRLPFVKFPRNPEVDP